MYIDCDSHYFPVKFLEGVSAKYPHSPRVVRNGDDVRSVLPDGTLIKNQAPKGRWHLDTRDQHVDWEGFDVHVLIPENRELLYTWDRDLGCELARAYNDAVAQDLKECAHPEKYFGVAWVFLPDVEESCREIERAVKTLGLKAVKFMGGFADANLGSEKLWPFYEKCCELDIPILVHDTASDRDGHPNPALVGIEQLYLEVENNALPFLLAFPFRYIVDIGSLILRGALKEFPKLRVCFVEGSAAFVPWLMDRLDMDPKAKKKLGKQPREFFNQIWVSAFAAENSLKYACDYWKDHNLTVGSDYPHGDPSATWTQGTVKMIKEMEGVSEIDKEKILGGNAMRLFGIQ